MANPEGSTGKPKIRCVGLYHDDVGSESLSEPPGPGRVQLYGDHLGARYQKLRGDRSRSGTDVEHEIAGPDAGAGHELRRPALSEPVITPSRPTVPGHGAP